MLCYSPSVGGQNGTPALALSHFISEKNVVQAPRVFKVNSYIKLSRLGKNNRKAASLPKLQFGAKNSILVKTTNVLFIRFTALQCHGSGVNHQEGTKFQFLPVELGA